MADLRTTAEERAVMRLACEAGFWQPSHRARVPLALDDLDTLLAEIAKLRAVAEAARDACNISLNDAGPEAFATIADLRRALAALEAP
jgi:hypothetical protein